MHEYHAVILLLSKPGHHNIWVLSLDIPADPAPGPSSHVCALRARAFPVMLSQGFSSVSLAMACKRVATRQWHLGEGPEVLKPRSVRPPGHCEVCFPLTWLGLSGGAALGMALGGERGTSIL